MESFFLEVSKAGSVEVAKGVSVKPIYCDERVMVLLFESSHGFSAHRHESFQIGVVLKGRGRFRIGGEVRVVGEGTFYYIPSNVEHEFEVLEGPVQALDIFMPPRPDYMKLFEAKL